jgi:hypothetical protein
MNRTNVPGATAQTFTIPAVTEAMANAQIRVRVDNAGFCPVESTNATLAVVLPSITSIFLQPGQGCRLQFSGSAGMRYTLETSTNLANWVAHTNLVAGPDGRFECLESMEPGTAACFYRLRWR